jgi:hypothetical protein
MGENNLGRIFQKGTGGDPAAGFRLLLNASGAIEFAVDYATADLSRVAVTGTIGTGTWRHLLATWDGSTVGSNMHLYLDGAEVSYASTGNASGARGDDSAANLQIGATSTGSGTFNGVLDDLRVYNRVLNASEIQSVYRAGVP